MGTFGPRPNPLSEVPPKDLNSEILMREKGSTDPTLDNIWTNLADDGVIREGMG
jgi:hypothetical protein